VVVIVMRVIMGVVVPVIMSCVFGIARHQTAP
jgi:hypothetical protein